MLGRKIAFTWGGSAINGVREKGIALAGEPVDLTSDESNGWRTLLEVNAPGDAGQNQVDVSISGVVKVDTLRAAWFGDRTKTATFTYPNGASISGEFFLASYNETGSYNDATTFEASLQSSGVVTYTPAA
jgi:predicted secreted protein